MSLSKYFWFLCGFAFLSLACDTKTNTVDSCGDGFVDPGEQCDSTVGENSCASLGYYNALGTLTCTSDCQFEDSLCGGRCGDGTVQEGGGEACDGGNLNGQTCQSLGYTGGTLACGAGCTYDVSGCSGKCGNGVIDAEEGEVCDGEVLSGETCVTRGYHGGALNCEADCSGYNLDACTAVGRCGDGIIQATFEEVCDGDDLDGQTCVDRGYSGRGGSLACTEGCRFDERACLPAGDDADLATLTVSAGTLTSAFDPGVGDYSVVVPTAVSSLTVTATAADAPWATVEISPPQPMSLAEGANPVTVAVTAEDGTTMRMYTVLITRASPGDQISPNIGILKQVPAGVFQRDGMATNLSVVSAFRMSKYEITRAQWTAVTGWADPSDVNYSGGMRDPVQQLNWYDAIAFCNKLSLAEGLTPVYSVSGVDFSTLTYAQIPASDNATWNAVTANWAATGYRLPTEMEWMWAAMGADTAAPGVTNTTGYAKAFAGSTGSNLIGDYAVFGYITSEPGRTTTERLNPVGSKLANELGFHDLSGNVSEWTWDWYATPYPTGTVTDYHGPASGIRRVRSGGDWYNPASGCAVAYRSYSLPPDRMGNFGFRVVRP
jgi:formylglycine-generating enzyme required for sulfatase activity